MKVKEKDCQVKVWTEVHFKMTHVPTGISVQEQDKDFPRVKEILLSKLKKKVK
jgi:protein subunit release factor A